MNIDYNSSVDDILLSEKHTAGKHFVEGTVKSSENSYNQGFQIGYQKGYDIGLEIGFYEGVSSAINKLHKSKNIILSDRELSTLQKLLNLIELFPRKNDINVDVINQYNEIKGLYRKFCFNLKVNNIDKSVLNFSKWNN